MMKRIFGRSTTWSLAALAAALLAGVALAAGGTSIYLPTLLKTVAGGGSTLPTPTPGAPTATPGPGTAASFALGPGHADTAPHQIVRTADDRLVLFAGKMATNVVRVYRQTTTGLPVAGTEFTPGATLTAPAGNVIAVEAATTGTGLIYVIYNTSTGGVYLQVYEVATDQFRAALTLATDGGQVNGTSLYAGTQGLSAAVDLTGALHVAYWKTGFRVTHCAYTYTNNQVTTCSPSAVDDGSQQASHPVVAVSPADGSLTVAWQSDPAANGGLNSRVLARRRATNGTWGAVETVSAVGPYYGRGSNGNEINVDTGPGLVIGTDGVRHLVFNQHFDSTGDYGRVIYVRDAGSGWATTSLDWYSHASTIALGAAGRVTIIGHGGPQSTSAVEACKNNRNMCYANLPAGGSWSQAQLVVAYTGDQSYDGSPSAKWSAVGLRRPEAIEFVFFSINDSTGQYYNPTLHYGRVP